MNTKSIRFRLTVLYSSALIISLAIIFFSFYLLTQKELFRQTDALLNSHALKLVSIVTNSSNEFQELMIRKPLVDEVSQYPGMIIFITDKDGNIIKSSQDLNNQVSISNLHQIAKETRVSAISNQKIASSNFRFIIYPIRNKEELIGTVIVGHPIDVITKSLTNMNLNLIIIFLLLVMPTILGSNLLAKKALQPIEDMSKLMTQMSSENLKTRLPNPKTRDEIEKLTQTINNLLDRIEASFTRERQFIGDVAHELKTPLSVLRSSIEVSLLKNRTSQEYRQSFKSNLGEIDRISQTLKNILDLAWSKSQTNIQSNEKVNLSQTVAEIEEIADKLAAVKNIAVKKIVTPNIFVKGRKDKIARALLNIIDNAIKYTNSGGKITISLHKTQTSAVVSINDTGIGLLQKEKSMIFNRFYRGKLTKDSTGSGLGLAISQSLITALGGRIKVTSKVGKGSTFTIFLPATS